MPTSGAMSAKLSFESAAVFSCRKDGLLLFVHLMTISRIIILFVFHYYYCSDCFPGWFDWIGFVSGSCMDCAMSYYGTASQLIVLSEYDRGCCTDGCGLGQAPCLHGDGSNSI